MRQIPLPVIMKNGTCPWAIRHRSAWKSKMDSVHDSMMWGIRQIKTTAATHHDLPSRRSNNVMRRVASVCLQPANCFPTFSPGAWARLSKYVGIPNVRTAPGHHERPALHANEARHRRMLVANPRQIAFPDLVGLHES